MTLWNLNTSTLHEEPPLMRGTSTAHEGSSLMAGGGAVYLNFDTDDGEISPNPSMIIEKHDEVQCSIPHGRWRCLYKWDCKANAKNIKVSFSL